jgi:hypothetical protein
MAGLVVELEVGWEYVVESGHAVVGRVVPYIVQQHGDSEEVKQADLKSLMEDVTRCGLCPDHRSDERRRQEGGGEMVFLGGSRAANLPDSTFDLPAANAPPKNVRG